MLASGGILLWALSGDLVQPLRWLPLRYLGRISYTFYLMHILALRLAERFIPYHPLGTGVAAIATLAYASASWHFLEEPLLGRKPKEPTLLLLSPK